MSDDNPHSTNGSSGKSWFDKLKLSFSGEPQSKEDLVEVITEAEQRELIDPQTREMIEGVIGVNEMRVRDIMIPRAQMVTIDIDQPVIDNEIKRIDAVVGAPGYGSAGNDFQSVPTPGHTGDSRAFLCYA